MTDAGRVPGCAGATSPWRASQPVGTLATVQLTGRGAARPHQRRRGHRGRRRGGRTRARCGLPALRSAAWLPTRAQAPASTPTTHAGDAYTAPVTPVAVYAMADAGVRTLYLQVACDDGEGAPWARRPGAGRPLPGAGTPTRAAGGRVGLPWFGDVARDLDHLRTIAAFEVLGHRFDGVAVDIEWTDTVTWTRPSARLASSSCRRGAGPDGCSTHWAPSCCRRCSSRPRTRRNGCTSRGPSLRRSTTPGCRWATGLERTVASGYRDAATYTAENLKPVARPTWARTLPVHAIGGLGRGETTPDDLAGFVAGVGRRGARSGCRSTTWATFPVEAQRLARRGACSPEGGPLVTG